MNEYNFDIDNVRNNVNMRDDPRGNLRGNAINEEIENDDQELFEEE